MNISELENKIEYTFKDKTLVTEALTHSSYANEVKSKDVRCNERLEFMGDSVLGMVTADYIYKNTKLPEGDLTRLKAQLVCEKALHGFANEIELYKYVRVGKGEERSGGRKRASLLADAFEALIAAIYFDGGMQEASKFILKFIIPAMNTSKPKPFRDYKTLLQEIVQKNPGEIVEYVLVSESGPDHNRHFVMEVLIDNNVVGRGGGKSKKEAEQQAAREALELMGY